MCGPASGTHMDPSSKQSDPPACQGQHLCSSAWSLAKDPFQPALRQRPHPALVLWVDTRLPAPIHPLDWDPAGVSRPGRLLDGPGPGCGLLRRPRRVTQARSPRGAGARKWREALSRPRAPHFPVPGQVSVLPGPAARLALFGPGRCLSVPPCDQGAHTRWRCAGGRRDRNESGGVR